MSIKLKKFDLQNIKNDATVLILGRRRSGKSWIIRDIMYTKQEIPSGVVYSNTANVNKFFHNFIPEAFIYDEMDINSLDKLIEHQEYKFKEYIKKYKIKNFDKCKKPFNKFIIMDDVLDDSSWVKERSIKKLLFNGRHVNFFYILAIQYINAIPQKIMSNFDYVFVLNESSLKNRKKIYDSFCGSIENFKTFNNILESCTTDHGCLVIDTHGCSMENSIFYYKSKNREEFHVGDSGFWKFSINNSIDKKVIKLK
jgi:hypothetical protein